jgi:hypothetical protein
LPVSLYTGKVARSRPIEQTASADNPSGKPGRQADQQHGAISRVFQAIAKPGVSLTRR